MVVPGVGEWPFGDFGMQRADPRLLMFCFLTLGYFLAFSFSFSFSFSATLILYLSYLTLHSFLTFKSPLFYCPHSQNYLLYT